MIIINSNKLILFLYLFLWYAEASSVKELCTVRFSSIIAAAVNVVTLFCISRWMQGRTLCGNDESLQHQYFQTVLYTDLPLTLYLSHVHVTGIITHCNNMVEEGGTDLVLIKGAHS